MTPDSNELLALADEYEAGTAKATATGYEEFGPAFQRKRKLIVDALRFVAAPQKPAPDAMREALKLAREEMVLAIAFLGRDVGTDRQTQTLHQLIARLATADKAARNALSAPVPSPDGAAEAILNSLEEIVRYLRRNDPAVYNLDEYTELLAAGIKQLRPPLSQNTKTQSLSDDVRSTLEDASTLVLIDKVRLGWTLSKEDTISIVAALRSAPVSAPAPAVGVTREAMCDIRDSFVEICRSTEMRSGSNDPYAYRIANEAIKRIDALSPAPDATVSARDAGADAMIGQIEERFPNWKSYRDLVDCIDVTLHNLRRGS